MAQIASLLVPSAAIPQPDSSWLSNLGGTLGGIAQNIKADRAFNGLADRIGGAPAASQPQQAGFLSRLVGGGQQQASAPMTAPVIPVQRQSIQQGLAGDPVQSVMDAGQRGSGNQPWLSYSNQGATRSQPINSKLEQSLSFLPDLGVTMQVFSGGQPDAAEGGARTGSVRHDNGNAADAFFFKDGRKLDWNNPQDRPIFEEIVKRGKAAGITGFGAGDGYMQPGSMHIGFGSPAVWGAGGRGSNAPDWLRTAYAGGAAPASSADAVNAMADGSLASAFSGDGPQPQAQQAIQQAAPNQVAQQGGNIIAPGVTPITRGSVDPSLIQYMLRDRNLREAGLKLWAANVQGQSPGEPWQFVTLPDGTLARANQQTGAVESLGQFAKPNAGYTVLSQEERQQLGIPSTDTRVYQKGADGKIDAVGGVGQTINIGNEVDQRRAAAAQAGLSPNDPGYQGFILTGKLPRENEQSLTATDKKAILEADEMVQNTQNVLPLIDRALELNDKAYSGPTAGVRGMITGAFGADGGEATQELDNVVINGALTQLKAIFGGAPTEGERSILLAMSGASNQPAPVRKTIFERARQAAQRRLDFYQQRANDMRGGTYYKPGSNTPAQSAPASGGSADIQAARDAIARGAPREAVIKRLQDAGIDTEGL